MDGYDLDIGSVLRTGSKLRIELTEADGTVNILEGTIGDITIEYQPDDSKFELDPDGLGKVEVMLHHTINYNYVNTDTDTDTDTDSDTDTDTDSDNVKGDA